MERRQTAIALTGPEGFGKSTLAEDLLEPIVGESNIKFIGNDQLKSQYNDYMVDVQFVIGEEVEGVARRAEAPKVKTIVTGRRVPVNAKYKPLAQARNFANLIVFSNALVPVFLKRGERRFLVSRTLRPRDENEIEALKTRIIAIKKFYVNGGAGKVKYYWKHLNLEGLFDRKAWPPRTEDHDNVTLQSGNSQEEFVQKLMTNPRRPAFVPFSYIKLAYQKEYNEELKGDRLKWFREELIGQGARYLEGTLNKEGRLPSTA